MPFKKFYKEAVKNGTIDSKDFVTVVGPQKLVNIIGNESNMKITVSSRVSSNIPQYLKNNPNKYVLVRAGELPNGNHSNGAVPNGNNGHVRADGYHTKLNGENINSSTIDNYGKRREIKCNYIYSGEKKMKIFKVIILFLILLGTNIICKEKNHGMKKEDIAVNSGKNEGLIFAKERQIFEQPDEKSKVVGVCAGLQPVTSLKSFESKSTNQQGLYTGENYEKINCFGTIGWIRYGLDLEYGNLDFLQKNLDIIKRGYEFEDEMGAAYGYGEISVHFDFKTLIVELNEGGGNIRQNYSNFSKTAAKKWNLKNDASEINLERLGKKIKFVVVAGDQKLKTTLHNKIFEFGASSE